jgi:hypothetical protein
MAKIFRWAGESFNVRISGKAKHNSGISYIQGTSYSQIYSDANAKGSFITSTQDALNDDDSVAKFTLLDAVNATGLSWDVNGQYATDTLKYDVAWRSGGVAHCEHDNKVTMCLPADTLTTYIPSSVWSDAGTVSVKAYVSNQHYPTTNVSAYKTATVNVEFDCEGIQNISTTANADAVFANISRSYYIPAAVEVLVNAKTKAGFADDATAASNEVISKGSAISLKNAVSAINFGETNSPSSSYTLYLIEGAAQSVNLSVASYNPGKAYSYAFEYVQTPSTSVVETDLTSLQTSSVMFTPVAVGVTRLKVKSTATSIVGGIVSNEVIIYVSPASTEIFINCGDAYIFTLQNEAHTAVIKDADKSIIKTTKNGTSLTIASISENFDDGVVEIDIMDGNVKVQTLTVYISHITLTVETGLTPLNPDAEL